MTVNFAKNSGSASAHSSLPAILITAVSLLLFLGMLRAHTSPQRLPDSESYLQFAAEIANGGAFTQGQAETVSLARATRTPGYPALIYTAGKLFGQSVGSVLIMHACFGLLALLSGLLLPSGILRAGLSIPPLLLALYDMSAWFPLILTEWVAVCLLLVYMMLWVRLAVTGTGRLFVVLLITASAMTIVRPALVVTLPVSLLAALFVRQKSSVKRSLLLFFGVSPVILWLFCNWWTIGSFSLSAFEGFNLLGVAASIGSAEERPGDSEEMETFISAVNEAKLPAKGQEIAALQSKEEGAASRYFDHNIYEAVIYSPAIQHFNPLALNRMSRTYALRVITAYPSRYIRYLVSGFEFVLLRKWLLLAALLCGLALLRIPELKALGSGLLAMLSVHMLHMLLCAAIQSVSYRYMNVTYYPLSAMLCISMLGLLMRRPEAGATAR